MLHTYVYLGNGQGVSKVVGESGVDQVLLGADVSGEELLVAHLVDTAEKMKNIPMRFKIGDVIFSGIERASFSLCYCCCCFTDKRLRIKPHPFPLIALKNYYFYLYILLYEADS
jgi:hypothetical protein